jgi:hypothetical protein
MAEMTLQQAAAKLFVKDEARRIGGQYREVAGAVTQFVLPIMAKASSM